MSEVRNNDLQQIQFDSIKIGLASPDKIREWSRGEVTKPETINYRTLKPEKDGLFCEKIFGPSKDWECHCGKYRKIRYKGIICDKCGVEVTKANVRRERMGHIELSAPVSHIWYTKSLPSQMGFLLDITPRVMDRVIYFANYIVLDPGETSLEYKQALTEREYQEALETWGGSFRVGMGAEAIKELLLSIDLEQEMKSLKEILDSDSVKGASRVRLIKRLEVVKAFYDSGNDPSWMILDAIPVIPPDLRPMVQLDGGRFATSDLNDLYRRIINRNNRLKKLLELGAPDIIVRNEKRMLQEAVDALIDNGRRGRAVTGPGNRALKSLSDMLKGKSGRFRQNLLGKRVDYSGRSVIVVGPELKIYQCGLPKEMAIELFKPFVMKELVALGISTNIRAAKKVVEKQDDQVWDILEEVIKEHPVMLNRAPTLHRLGIQAFEPILVEGKAIKLHPLVCTAFNADFDGDQMAVHLPLTVEAQAECRFLLLSPNNLLKPSDGAPVAVPSQDMVLGIYYLTQERPGTKGEGKFFHSVNEAILAYENGIIDLHAKIKVRMCKTLPTGEEIIGSVESTLGRFLFNEIIPQDLGFVKRDTNESLLLPEIDFLVGKKEIKKILEKVINIHGATKTAEVLDLVKATGYKYSTRAAMTVSISDMTVPPIKKQLLEDAQAQVDKITEFYRRGIVTEEERYEGVKNIWKKADDTLTEALLDGLGDYNNIKMMADSGARGSKQQMKQLAGMRGLMQDTSGRTIELPIKSNFREGLDVLEYFISAHGARKGLSDTALRTADSGYLTRRMVDVSQELVISEIDCAKDLREIPGRYVKTLVDGNETIELLENRIRGRYSVNEIRDKEGNVLVKANHMITPKRAAEIVEKGIGDDGKPFILEETGKYNPDSIGVKIRTLFSCKCKVGLCAKCYGANMASGETVQIGEAVGVIAAQSIGEPGTQLTMRTFHTGGVAGNDITQGLPRVEELFEARKPKGVAIISEFPGTVTIVEEAGKREIIVSDGTREKAYTVNYGQHIAVENNQQVEAGECLTDGPINLKDLLVVKDIEAVENYLIREVQKVYGLQGVDLADKHIEVIGHQMMKKQMIEDAGDSDLLPTTMMDRIEIEAINEKLIEEGKRPIVAVDQLLPINKIALASNSFLSAASFQETTKVLTDAAIRGRIDPLIGLKENVILGKLIPAGTGISRYKNVKLSTDPVEFEDDGDINFDDFFAEEDGEEVPTELVGTDSEA